MSKKFRLLVCILLTVSVCLGFSFTASATPGHDGPEWIDVTLHGDYLIFDVDPEIIGGRTMVPMRVIFEAMGASVSWNASTRTITATRGSTTVQTTIGSRTIRINGAARTIDVAPVVIGGRTLVPVRFISEAFGYDVRWDGNELLVAITGGTRPTVTVPSQLVGRWRSTSNGHLHFFGRNTDIEFFSDGRIYSVANSVYGSFIATGNGRFALRWHYPEFGPGGYIAVFTYSLSGGTLTITGIDGIQGTYVKR